MTAGRCSLSGLVCVLVHSSKVVGEERRGEERRGEERRGEERDTERARARARERERERERREQVAVIDGCASLLTSHGQGFRRGERVRESEKERERR
jgi:hypothetical protein